MIKVDDKKGKAWHKKFKVLGAVMDSWHDFPIPILNFAVNNPNELNHFYHVIKKDAEQLRVNCFLSNYKSGPSTHVRLLTENYEAVVSNNPNWYPKGVTKLEKGILPKGAVKTKTNKHEMDRWSFVQPTGHYYQTSMSFKYDDQTPAWLDTLFFND